MERLKNITIEDLQKELNKVKRKKPTLRLTAAIAYKNGISQTELANWYNVQRKTIYNWLKKIEEKPIKKAIQDDKRTGRKRKLTKDQQTQLENALHKPPKKQGYNRQAWTTKLVQKYLKEHFNVDYSKSSCRRLMKEAGLSYQKPRKKSNKKQPEDRKDFDKKIKKSDNKWMPP